MDFLKKYPIFRDLLKPFRRSQQKTCAAIVSSLCQASQASSFAIAGQLSSLSDVQFGSALNRLYRFLRNESFDNWLLTQQLLVLLGGEEKKVLVCLDWTKWQDRFSVLTASVCVGTRSLPIAATACVKRELARSQNLWEETFLRLCVERLRLAGVSAVWLCDRGFHRVAWLKRLLELKQDFVVRLQGDVSIHLAEGAKVLKQIKLKRGGKRDFGFVAVRVDEFVRVRVIGVWEKQAKEIWWLATNMDAPLAQIVSLYDRRMGIEEQFRDAKGVRFGMKLKWTQFTKAAFVERMFLLVGIAMLLWTTIGQLVEKREPKVRLQCQRKGARLSLVRVGFYYWQRVTEKVGLTKRLVQEQLPPPRIRSFKWLTANQN